ncbi:NAD(P)H-binding protein [Streptomyces parvus]|uniref:NAD(P)H-binding protein n=1 Tax=Streptomyces parvus TaxID=66428 RepID=UPI001653D382|nr:NAD(P)H-binding protein [Streptomyces parvus]
MTGASGKVGSRVVAELTGRDIPVRAASRRSQFRLDWTEPAGWDRVLDGVRCAFLVVPGGDDGHRNVSGLGRQVIRFLDQAAKHGMESVVLMTALGMQYAPEQVEQRAVELCLQNSGMRWTILRPNWFHQNLSEGVMHELATANDGVLALPLEEATCSLVDARDIAAVAATALIGDHHGREYDLTGPEALTFERIAQLTSASSLAVRAYQPVTDGQFTAAARALGWDAAYVAQLSELFATIRTGAAAQLTADVAQVLGRDPVSLHQFLQDPAHCP